jgi:hypothetical protein
LREHRVAHGTWRAAYFGISDSALMDLVLPLF